jgi:hypothetical protein
MNTNTKYEELVARLRYRATCFDGLRPVNLDKEAADAIEELLKGDKGNLAVHLAEPESRLTAEDIGILALDAGFMLSTQYGQTPPKLMPVSDSRTLVNFARKVIKAHMAESGRTPATVGKAK